MKEILLYTVAFIASLALIVFSNNYVNKVKTERCNEMGGTIVLNITDGNITSCIVKAK